MIRQVLLVPHTHHDVGYTDSPRVVGDAHVRIVDEVLRLCEAHGDAGRISVTGGYLNMTQLPSAAELDAGYDMLASLRGVGLLVRTQQHGDVNGIAWWSVEGMRRAGYDTADVVLRRQGRR